jgi:hypothetical protein
MCVMDHFKVKMFITKLSLLLCFLGESRENVVIYLINTFFYSFARSGQCKVSIFNMNWLSNRAKFGVTSVIKRLTG